MSLKNQAGILLISAVFSLLICGCAAPKTEGQKIFGYDADYFAGLQYLNQKKYNEARSKFLRCQKKGSYWCARKSAEALTQLGDVQEKNKSAENFYATYNDSDSLLIATRQLSSANELHKLIQITQNIDFSHENNETIKLRLEAKQKRGDSSLQDEVFEWFTARPLSSFHLNFYKNSYNQGDFPQNFDSDFQDFFDDFSPSQFSDFLINFRVKIYERNYTQGFDFAQKLLLYFENAETAPLPQIASDLGKACLYGSSDFEKNAATFAELARKFKNSDSEFYFWFYAGRFYSKTQNQKSKSDESFINAINCVKSPENKDNAIWYLLDTNLDEGLSVQLNFLKIYANQWSDASYFDDFFEKLILALLSGGNWNGFYELYSTVSPYASTEISAQIIYIYGRLLQEGLAKSEKWTAKDAFQKSLDAGTSAYYKILSAYKLGFSENEIQNLLCNAPNTKKTYGLDSDTDKYLKGLAYYGFPEKIYSEYMNLYKNGISTDTALYLSEFLQKCGEQNHDFYTQSLRIAARAMNYGDRPFTKDELKLLYPLDYQEIVDSMCQKYNCSEPVMYALIRSESFFDADVASSAGAIGLCQLMDFTAADIAKKLRRSEYSLTNPQDNIEFGCYYLNNLYSRCEFSYLQAFFSYNAGITRVRRWLKTSMNEFGKKSNMPGDLFLESLPYSETREYGRKLVSAAVVYNWLYSSDSEEAFADMVENLIY